MSLPHLRGQLFGRFYNFFFFEVPFNGRPCQLHKGMNRLPHLQFPVYDIVGHCKECLQRRGVLKQHETLFGRFNISSRFSAVKSWSLIIFSIFVNSSWEHLWRRESRGRVIFPSCRSFPIDLPSLVLSAT